MGFQKHIFLYSVLQWFTMFFPLPLLDLFLCNQLELKFSGGGAQVEDAVAGAKEMMKSELGDRWAVMIVKMGSRQVRGGRC